MRLSYDEFLGLYHRGGIKDISSELPDAFLVVGQFMRAKVLYQDKKWFAAGWTGAAPYVSLQEAAL